MTGARAGSRGDSDGNVQALDASSTSLDQDLAFEHEALIQAMLDRQVPQESSRIEPEP